MTESTPGVKRYPNLLEPLDLGFTRLRNRTPVSYTHLTLPTTPYV